MKVLDLRCVNGHPFEGWFSNEEDYQRQHNNGWLQCPICASASVDKVLSAPRLNLRSSHGEPAQPAAPATPPTDTQTAATGVQQQLMRAWLEVSRRVMAATEDVGERFAEEARKIHYGEVEERGIRGKASPQQFQELLEEGVGVLPLAVPDAAKGTLQ